jgi:hypothetical protein
MIMADVTGTMNSDSAQAKENKLQVEQQKLEDKKEGDEIKAFDQLLQEI